MVLRRDRGRQLVQVDGGRIQGDGCGLCVCVAVGCGMCLCVFLLQGGRDASNRQCSGTHQCCLRAAASTLFTKELENGRKAAWKGWILDWS